MCFVLTGDGVFSFGMMAEFEQPIKTYGPHIYRYLFWEAGMLGQVMYLEAEAVGIRATGSSHSFMHLQFSLFHSYLSFLSRLSLFFSGVQCSIGCYFDDEVHNLFGITDHTFQSMYHFTVGNPVEGGCCLDNQTLSNSLNGKVLILIILL